MPQMKSPNMIEQIKKMAASGHKVRKIAKVLGVSRNTVRKYLRNDTGTVSGGQLQGHPPQCRDSARLRSFDKNKKIEPLRGFISRTRPYKPPNDFRISQGSLNTNTSRFIA